MEMIFTLHGTNGNINSAQAVGFLRDIVERLRASWKKCPKVPCVYKECDDQRKMITSMT